MIQTCRNTNVHVVNTDKSNVVETYFNVYGLHDSTNQCAQYELKIAYKTRQQKLMQVFFFFEENDFFCFHAITS